MRMPMQAHGEIKGSIYANDSRAKIEESMLRSFGSHEDADVL